MLVLAMPDVRLAAFRCDMRAQMAVVLQDSYLFHGSDRRPTSGSGEPDATVEEQIAAAAAQAANAHEFINAAPARATTP